MEYVTWDTLPRKMLVPILIRTANPIAARKRNGSTKDPHIENSTASRKMPATIKMKKGMAMPLVSSLRTVTAVPSAKAPGMLFSIASSSGDR